MPGPMFRVNPEIIVSAAVETDPLAYFVIESVGDPTNDMRVKRLRTA